MGKLTRAGRNIDWIEEWCRVPEGKFVGGRMKLREWQKDELRKIYDNPHGTRLAIISFGKKNAKTTLAACLLLLHLAGPEARPNSQLPSTAQSKDQASVLFKLAAKMVRMNPAFDGTITIRDTAKELLCPELGTFYKALSAEASTAHGQSPVFAVHDELGQVRGPISELYNAIENAMGAHDDPLSVIISTQAPNDADLLSVLIDDALQGNDPHTIVSLYTADPDLDPFSEEAMRQANPAFGDFLNAKEVKKQAEEARRMPSQEAFYRNYQLNQRVEVSSPFISRSVWQECGGDVAKIFDGPVWGGLDLSGVHDLTAKVWVSPIDGVWHVKPTFWLPEVGLAEKARADRQIYDVWAKQGFLKTTPGKSIQYEFVAQTLFEDCERMDVRKIAFDRWNFTHFKPWLLKAGFSESQLEGENALFESFGQGFQSMSPALRTLETDILEGRLLHGNHPVLAMCAANSVIKTDDAGNRKLVKPKDRRRIDGMIALAMGRAVAGTYQEKPPVISPWEDEDAVVELL